MVSDAKQESGQLQLCDFLVMVVVLIFAAGALMFASPSMMRYVDMWSSKHYLKAGDVLKKYYTPHGGKFTVYFYILCFGVVVILAAPWRAGSECKSHYPKKPRAKDA